MKYIDADDLAARLIGDKYKVFREILQSEQEAVVSKRGKWINGKCSNCGEHAPFWAMASTYHESTFCPNCGADMRGTE